MLAIAAVTLRVLIGLLYTLTTGLRERELKAQTVLVMTAGGALISRSSLLPGLSH